MADRVDQAIAAAIDDAIVDLEAPAGERVRFDPDQLAAVAALSGDDVTRNRVIAVLRSRLSDAVLALEPAVPKPSDWHDAHAAQALLSRVQDENVAGEVAQP